jgi:hypothetical protein
VEKSRWHVTFQVPFVHFNGPRAGQRKIGRRSWMLVSWALTEKRQSRTHDAAAYFAHIALCASHPPAVGESREQMQQLHAVPLKCCEGLCSAVLCCAAEGKLWLVLYKEPSFTQAKCLCAPLHDLQFGPSARFSATSLLFSLLLGWKLASQANLGDMPYCRCSTFDLSSLYFGW